MKIILDTQDITNAVCVSTAFNLGTNPEMIDAEVGYHDNRGFWAEGQLGFRRVTFNEADLRDAIAFMLREWHSFIPEQLLISMTYHPEVNEFEAEILVDSE